MACRSKNPKKSHLKSAKYKVANWSSYNKALINRGRITVWIEPGCNIDWYYDGPREPGGKVKYSDMAIEMNLQVRQVYHQPLRQTQGLVEDVVNLMGLALDIPSYSVVSKRAKKLKLSVKRFSKKEMETQADEYVYMIIDSTGLKIYGEGEWALAKHKTKQRKSWRKLHISVGIDAQIKAVTLTNHLTDDASQVGPLRSQINEDVSETIGDGAYDSRGVYEELQMNDADIKFTIPPRNSAVQSDDTLFRQRNDHIDYIDKNGRSQWERTSGYTQQARVENTMYRYKTIIGGKLRSRHIESQETEAVLSCSILNTMADLGMPVSYRAA